MPPTIIGGRSFTIRTIHRAGGCVAQAVRADTGDRFGPDFAGSVEAEAVAGVTRWLEWQRDHAAALEALQEAERIYHRSVAERAFGRREEGEAHLRARRESLDKVDSARATLDAVRARRPS